MNKLGGLDILFNNAGVSHRALVEETTDENWDRVFGVNVTAMFKLCREAIHTCGPAPKPPAAPASSISRR